MSVDSSNMRLYFTLDFTLLNSSSSRADERHDWKQLLVWFLWKVTINFQVKHILKITRLSIKTKVNIKLCMIETSINSFCVVITEQQAVHYSCTDTHNLQIIDLLIDFLIVLQVKDEHFESLKWQYGHFPSYD